MADLLEGREVPISVSDSLGKHAQVLRAVDVTEDLQAEDTIVVYYGHAPHAGEILVQIVIETRTGERKSSLIPFGQFLSATPSVVTTLLTMSKIDPTMIGDLVRRFKP